MRRFLGIFGVAMVGLASAGPALATDQNINLEAIVTSFCRIDNSLAPGDDSATIPTPSANVDTTAIVRTYAVVCNKATNTTLTSTNGGLSGPTAATGFEHIINYTAATSGFVTIAAGSTATTATVGAAEVLGGPTARATPGSANITVTITPLANTDPLVEGTYNDTLRVSIVPQ